MYYEVIILIKESKNRNKELEIIKKLLIDIKKKEILDVNYIGKRRLAYNIKKEKYACYIILTLIRDIKIIEIIKKNIRYLKQKVIRYLILKTNIINKDKIK
ncbi:30S ribosomal protein S6 [Candidatus Vidania fulgoroideorum]